MGLGFIHQHYYIYWHRSFDILDTCVTSLFWILVLFFCVWYILMPINSLSPFPFRISGSFIKLIIALFSLVRSSAYLKKNTQWSNIINDINIVEGFGTGNEYIWILTFCLSPLTYQLIKYTKVEKKKYIKVAFPYVFPWNGENKAPESMKFY